MDTYPYRCLAFSTDSTNFFSTPGWHVPWGRLLCISIKKRRYPRLPHVKYTTPVHGACILAAHGDRIDTVVLSHVDEMCAEYDMLIHLLSYWRHRHHILLVSRTLPPPSYLESFFPHVERHYFFFQEAPVRYLVEEGESLLTFDAQRRRLENWLLTFRHDYPRIVLYMASLHQCEMMKAYWEVIFPEEKDNKMVIMTTGGGGGGDEIPDGSVDLVVDFGRYQKKCRAYYGATAPCCQTTMKRRRRKARPGGLVLHLMSESDAANRPCFIEADPEWRSWGALFLASLGLPYREILGMEEHPLEKWGLDLDRSSKKRLKTFLQHPFSIRAHLMLERCRMIVVESTHRLWCTLAITLLHWLDHHHRFLVSQRSFLELQCIYGNDDELWIHMRIALLVLSGSPMIHVDFCHAEGTIQKFCLHFQKALSYVYGKKQPPPFPSNMSIQDMDAVRYFLMTDARVERYFPTYYHHSFSYWNSISYLHSFSVPNQQCVMVLNHFTTSEDNPRITLWTFMPSWVVHFRRTLYGYLQKHREEQEAKEQHVSHFKEQVVGYFQKVLVHVPW